MHAGPADLEKGKDRDRKLDARMAIERKADALEGAKEAGYKKGIFRFRRF
jgi:hypothetical protein